MKLVPPARWESETARRKFRRYVVVALGFNTAMWVGHLAGWWR